MAKARVQAVHFERINKSKLKNSSRRTRTGALSCCNRSKNHGKHYKH